ncbi:N-alpha-acetyltransferase 20-like isoform X2 [Varroa jacobsoni]|uniref:N-alpha-acetyltransferase 20-like isoform X2 n=1 Tax=Varroa jacobsoni TaxID=62625 RepID=UPI000BF58417|nr:N-alpha-acetyltransferase 20-like isoform X2 [Varroa jacobsoni]
MNFSQLLMVIWRHLAGTETNRNSDKMTTVRPFRCRDLLTYNNVNLDVLTETYGVSFYLTYLARWPEYFQALESVNGDLMGYIMGKAEGFVNNWHGHVTALSVAPEYRRLGLANKLMDILEEISEHKECYFVDLFVRQSNTIAIDMYKRLGYIIYRRVIGYYSSSGSNPDEDGFDMRKALSKDVNRQSVIPLTKPVRPEDLE